MPPEIVQALIILGVALIGVMTAILGGIALLINANFKRRAIKIADAAKWEQEQLEMRLQDEARKRQVSYEEKMAEIAEKADMRAALDRQSQQLENAVNAIVDIAKSDSRKTEVLAANTNALSANTQTIEILGDKMNDVVEILNNTGDKVDLTYKSAENAIADHKLIMSRLDTIEAKVNNITALFTPVPNLDELPKASGL